MQQLSPLFYKKEQTLLFGGIAYTHTEEKKSKSERGKKKEWKEEGEK